MKHLLSCGLLVVSALNATVSAAAPLITTINGTFAEGNQVTITGTGFGDGPNVVLFDDFESGTVGDPIKIGANSATVGEWDGYGITKPVYFDSGCHGGLKCFRADMAAHWLAYTSIRLPGSGASDVFMSYWVKLPAGDSFPGETVGARNWKIVWIMGANSAQNAITIPVGLGLPDSSMPPYFDLACNGCPIQSNISLGGVNWGQGKWNYFSYWIRASNTDSGRIKFWYLDDAGIKLANPGKTDRPTVQNSGDLFRYIHVNGYGRQEANSHPMFDDVYVATGLNAQARIEIGNSPNYSSSTKVAIMTPVSWEDNRVIAAVRQGIFKSGESAYAFVIDGLGNVSSGYQVTIGLEPPNKVKPAPPTDLRVNPL